MKNTMISWHTREEAHDATWPAVQESNGGKRLNYNFLYRAAMLDGYWKGMG